MKKTLMSILFCFIAFSINAQTNIHDSISKGKNQTEKTNDWINNGYSEIAISDNFDGGSCPQYSIEKNKIIFNHVENTKTGGNNINVFIDKTPKSLNISIVPSMSNIKHWTEQGLFFSHDGDFYTQIPFDFADSTEMRLQIETFGKIWLASSLPYGRNRLDLLFSDTHNSESLKTYILKRENRIVPVFQFGDDDGKKIIHYIIAGECAWETAGQWVADYMVRELCDNKILRESLTKNSVIRIIPHISPYSATRSLTSYTPLTGEKIYGAATWGDKEPPTEYALIRNEVVKVILERRLGFMLTVHSWYSLSNHSGIETIRSSGNNRIEGKRFDWAQTTLSNLVSDVPRLKWSFPERIWHEGLARDYLLKEYNAITFRIEVTTHDIDYEFLEKVSKMLLKNISEIKDWDYVLNQT